MKRLLCLFVFFAGAASAQLQLFQFDGTTETAVASLYQLPSSAPGDIVVTRFRLFNNGAGAASFQSLSIAGEDFEILAAPSLPYVIAPGSFAEFKVQFSPEQVGSYSANLLVNTIVVSLLANVIAEPVLSAGSTQLAVGGTFDFGKILFGTSTSQTFTLANPNSTTITVSQITVTGAGFKGPAGITTPLTLAPGQSTTFQASFAPAAGQTYTGSLSVGSRIYNLTGLGLSPPLPAATIRFAATTVTSALQTTLTIQLASTSQVAGTGTLTLKFQPSVTGVTDDPAIQFMTGPPRVATVTVSAGDSIAKFGTASSITFQTGSTAGTLVFDLELGTTTEESTLTIAPAAVYLDTASGELEAGAVIVGLIGYDNTYSVSELQFAFYDTNGKALPPGLITANVSKDFQSYFETTTAGGSFQLRAEFPVSGDSAVVGSVDVSITNSVGVTHTQRVNMSGAS